ncbi:putative membrane protein [Lachnospiraceae bacterium PFB1-21]
MRLPLCNKRKETAPQLGSHTFFLCWRCTTAGIAILAMYLVGKYVIGISICAEVAILGILFMVPMVLDGSRQYFSKYESTNKKRAISGLLFGIGLGAVLAAFL